MFNDFGTPMNAPSVNVTSDGLWEEEELNGDVYDECTKIMKDLVKKYEHRAIYDKDLLLPTYMSEKICTEYDLIEEYNKSASKDKNKFGIYMFDEWLHNTIKNNLKNNLVKG